MLSIAKTANPTKATLKVPPNLTMIPLLVDQILLALFTGKDS
jgi:hypothetical protein